VLCYYPKSYDRVDRVGVVSGQLLSMGYGFVEYKRPSTAKEALKLLQHAMLDGHQLELKLSNRTTLWVLTLFSRLNCSG